MQNVNNTKSCSIFISKTLFKIGKTFCVFSKQKTTIICQYFRIEFSGF